MASKLFAQLLDFSSSGLTKGQRAQQATQQKAYIKSCVSAQDTTMIASNSAHQASDAGSINQQAANTLAVGLAPLVNIPYEVLLKVKPDRRDLHSLVLVNRSFYNAFVGRLYESFKHCSDKQAESRAKSRAGRDLSSLIRINDKFYQVIVKQPYDSFKPGKQAESRAGRVRAFITTIMNVPTLGEYVKQLTLDDLWWVDHESHGVSCRRNSGCFQKGHHQSDDHVTPRLLSNLTKLEQLTISLPRFQNFLSGERFTNLKELTITGVKGMEIPPITVVQALSITTLKVLKLGVGGKNGPKLRQLLSEIPPRSLNIETLEFDPKSINNQYEMSAMTFLAIMSKFKSLKNFIWTRECPHGCWYHPVGGECRRVHCPVLQEALLPFRKFLEKLELRMPRTVQCRSYSVQETLFCRGFFTQFTSLKSILIDHEILTSYFYTGTQNSAPAFLYDNLPSSLQEVKFYINLDHENHDLSIWNSLVLNLVANHQPRLPALKSIVYVHDASSNLVCSRCGSSAESVHQVWDALVLAQPLVLRLCKEEFGITFSEEWRTDYFVH